MKVTLIKIPDTITNETVLQYLADCSSVVRQKQPRTNENLLKRLMKESYGDKPSRVLEYLPCKLSKELVQPKGQYFGFWSTYNSYHTNARELLNWGWTWEEVLKVIDFTDYKTVKVTAPYFSYGQISTHTQITSVSHSARYTESDLGYWYPKEFSGWYLPHEHNNTTKDEYWNYLVTHTTPVELQLFMKDILKVKRREVYARGSDMLQYRTSTLGGYTSNLNAWPHFINQRLNDSHTQKETREVSALINSFLDISITIL